MEDSDKVIDIVKIQKSIISNIANKAETAGLRESLSALKDLDDEEVRRAILNIEKERMGIIDGIKPIERVVSILKKCFLLIKQYDKANETHHWQDIIKHITSLKTSRSYKPVSLQRVFTDEDFIKDWNGDMPIKRLMKKYQLRQLSVYTKAQRLRDNGVEIKARPKGMIKRQRKTRRLERK